MILVTGGMIGAHTARALTDLGHEAVVTALCRTEVLVPRRPGHRGILRRHRPGRLRRRLTHDTGFAPTFDVVTAVAGYVAWRADHPR